MADLEWIHATQATNAKGGLVAMHLVIPGKHANTVEVDMRAGGETSLTDDVPIDRTNDRILNLIDRLNGRVGITFGVLRNFRRYVEVDQSGENESNLGRTWPDLQPNIQCIIRIRARRCYALEDFHFRAALEF